MGNSGSKGKKKDKKKGSSDDGCIGNRRVRTIILSILFAVFFVFAAPYAQGSEDLYRDLDGVPLVGTATCILLAGGDTDVTCEDFANAWAFVFAGAMICIVGAIAAVLLFLIPNCDDKLGRVAGFVLIVGGIVYMIGWIWLIFLLRPPDDIYDALPEEAQNNLNGILTSLFGEALLAGGSAILLGLDAAFQMYENEAFRLSSNLSLIGVVAALCIGGYFSQICEEDTLLCATPDGVEAIATGYLILFWVCLIYIILYILTCCTCDCKDKCLIRLIIAVALIIGGVITAIGYYVYIGAEDTDFDNVDDDGAASLPTKRVVYFVGYSILIGGLSVVWALDMAFDDVKNR